MQKNLPDGHCVDYVRRRANKAWRFEVRRRKKRRKAPEAASQETCSFAAAGQASEKSGSERMMIKEGSVLYRSLFCAIRLTGGRQRTAYAVSCPDISADSGENPEFMV